MVGKKLFLKRLVLHFGSVSAFELRNAGVVSSALLAAEEAGANAMMASLWPADLSESLLG